MPFDPKAYGDEVAAILQLDGNGERLMPLALGRCSSEPARRRLSSATAHELLPDARAPEAALGGLYLYFSCLDEAHAIVQNISSADGSYWHAILHRQEPDVGNSAYWIRRIGAHPIFPALRKAAEAIAAKHGGEKQPGERLFRGTGWDPMAFLDLCESARQQPGSPIEAFALEVQRAEWQLLFDDCARKQS